MNILPAIAAAKDEMVAIYRDLHANPELGFEETRTSKIVAEKLNGRFAMLGFIALLGAYLTTGQIIPGFI